MKSKKLGKLLTFLATSTALITASSMISSIQVLANPLTEEEYAAVLNNRDLPEIIDQSNFDSNGNLQIEDGGLTFTVIEDKSIYHDEGFADQELFREWIGPLDVCQGKFGDCYFASAVQALAQYNPSAIYNSMKKNGNSVTVRFYHHDAATQRNIPYYYIVSLNVLNDSHPFSAPWFKIFEKAYAAHVNVCSSIDDSLRPSDAISKIDDITYLTLDQAEVKNLTQGWPFIAGYHITGNQTPKLPVYPMNDDEAIDFFEEKIANSLGNNKGLILTTSKNKDIRMLEPGIANKHSIAVLDILRGQPTDKEGETVDLIKVRNQWDCGEGKYVKNHEKDCWELVPSEYGSGGLGVFYIELKHALSVFSSLTIIG